jgi:hypothetical protein
MTDFLNGYCLTGTKVHRIRVDNKEAKTLCGRYAFKTITKNDLKLAELKGQLCKICYTEVQKK